MYARGDVKEIRRLGSGYCKGYAGLWLLVFCSAISPTRKTKYTLLAYCHRRYSLTTDHDMFCSHFSFGHTTPRNRTTPRHGRFASVALVTERELYGTNRTNTRARALYGWRSNYMYASGRRERMREPSASRAKSRLAARPRWRVSSVRWGASVIRYVTVYCMSGSCMGGRGQLIRATRHNYDAGGLAPSTSVHPKTLDSSPWVSLLGEAHGRRAVAILLVFVFVSPWRWLLSQRAQNGLGKRLIQHIIAGVDA